jgi:hypothetical protein
MSGKTAIFKLEKTHTVGVHALQLVIQLHETYTAQFTTPNTLAKDIINVLPAKNLLDDNGDPTTPHFKAFGVTPNKKPAAPAVFATLEDKASYFFFSSADTGGLKEACDVQTNRHLQSTKNSSEKECRIDDTNHAYIHIYHSRSHQ